MARVPEHVRNEVRVELEVTDRHLTVLECRAPWHSGTDEEWTGFPIARLRFTKRTDLRSLLWRDRHSRFHEYHQVPATPRVEELLAELDRDPTAIFWG